MEILLDPTIDGLAMNQWAVQSLVWAYMARHPNAPCLRHHDAANITYIAIIEKVQNHHAWKPNELLEFNLATIHWVLHTGLAIQTDQVAVRGVCRFCGCTGQYGCVISPKDAPVATCTWMDSNATICTSRNCTTRMTMERANPTAEKILRAAIVALSGDGDRVHAAKCSCEVCVAKNGVMS